MSFILRLKERLTTTDSHLCVGLDSDYSRIPNFITKKLASFFKRGLTVEIGSRTSPSKRQF
jgi:hypothetical protein